MTRSDEHGDPASVRDDEEIEAYEDLWYRVLKETPPHARASWHGSTGQHGASGAGDSSPGRRTAGDRRDGSTPAESLAAIQGPPAREASRAAVPTSPSQPLATEGAEATGDAYEEHWYRSLRLSAVRIDEFELDDGDPAAGDEGPGEDVLTDGGEGPAPGTATTSIEVWGGLPDVREPLERARAAFLAHQEGLAAGDVGPADEGSDGHEGEERSTLAHDTDGSGDLSSDDLERRWSALLLESADRSEAIEIAANGDRAALVEHALGRLDVESDPERALAVEVLGLGTQIECLDGAERALEDPEALVRRSAAIALTRIATPRSIPALGRALTDADVSVRQEVVRALGTIDDGSTFAFLMSAMGDRDADVRATARTVLARGRSPEVVRRIAALLSDPDLRDSIARLLRSLGADGDDLLQELASGDG